METKINVRGYLVENCKGYFTIPAYQRGFKWGVPNADGDNDAAILLVDILNAMQAKKEEYFIQGVTVYEKENEIILIDGQQRTTTLFLMLNELMTHDEKSKYLFFDNNFKLKYKIRKSSHDYLAAICNDSEYSGDHNTQDIFYFKEAQKQICGKIGSKDKEKIKEYILDKVMLFYIKVPEDQAANVFSMLNGAKAFMKTDELIKSDFLCKASYCDNMPKDKNTPSTIDETFEILREQIGQDWESNAIRSQYARLWDKWLYWWNRSDVKVFFYSGNNPLGLLLEFFYENEIHENPYSNAPDNVAVVFKAFQNTFLKKTKDSKLNFEKLRKLQKKFEDIFNQPHFYNFLGLALIAGDRKTTIRYFIENFKDKESVRKYALLRLVDVTDKEIRDNNKIIIIEKIASMKHSLSKSNVYCSGTDDKEHAFRQLFMLNVLVANQRHVKFEFMYWSNNDLYLYLFYDYRSLEHIWPKSKVIFKDENGILKCYTEKSEIVDAPAVAIEMINSADFPEEISEHCIGNLVFLHKHDNSKFNAKLPEEKKKVYFDLSEKTRLVYSHNLLHTMSVFAGESWTAANTPSMIENNKSNVEKAIEKEYENYAK